MASGRISSDIKQYDYRPQTRLRPHHISISSNPFSIIFPYFHWTVGTAQRICVSMCRGIRIILPVTILILFCFVRHLSSAVTIFDQSEVSFCSSFIETAINLRNSFFPLSSDASRNIYDLILTSFVLKYKKKIKIKMNRHWQAWWSPKSQPSPKSNPKWVSPFLDWGL